MTTLAQTVRHTSPSKIRWSSYVGGLQWRSTPTIIGSDIIVGTSGEHWNASDKRDGFYCLRVADGTHRWFVPTYADVNEIEIIDGFVIAGTDDGFIYQIELGTGHIADRYLAGSPCYSKPLVLGRASRWRVVVVDHNGGIHGATKAGAPLQRIAQLPFSVRANLIRRDAAAGLGERLLVFGESGEIAEIAIDDNFIGHRLLWNLVYPNHWSANGQSRGGIAGTPRLVGEQLFLGFVRETYYDTPPLLCLDITTGEVVWWAHTGADSPSFGNCRTTPLFIAGQLIAAFAYTDSLYSFSPETGECLWNVPLGPETFQQWASPTALDDAGVLLGRVDGVLSKIDVFNHRLVWSLSLQIAEAEPIPLKGRTPIQNTEAEIWMGEALADQPPLGAICSTPVIERGMIFTGTTSGWLYCIADR